MPEGLSEEFKEEFEPLVASFMVRDHIPGMSIAIVQEDQVIYARGFGARNLALSLPATPQTLWGIGSCTKSFTALAIMQLVEDDKVDLQAPVSNYIPEIRLGKNADPPLSIHHLLTHASGLPSLLAVELLIDRICRQSESWVPLNSWNDFFLHFNGASEEVTTAPGINHFYNNSGYSICGAVIERVSKMSFAEYVKEKIFRPLKMERSTVLKELAEKDPDVLTPYLLENKGGQISATTSSFPSHMFLDAPGGIFSSVEELTNYLRMTMNDGRFETRQLVEPSSLQLMQTRHIGTTRFHGQYGDEGYGYGWIIAENFLGHRLIYHAGSVGVSSALIGFIPELNIGFAEGANMGTSPRPLMLSTFALLLGKDPKEVIPFFKIEMLLDSLAGVYKTYNGIRKVSVTKKTGLLFLSSADSVLPVGVSPGESIPFVPASDNLYDMKFYISTGPGEKLPVTFYIDSSGNVELFIERYRLRKQSFTAI